MQVQSHILPADTPSEAMVPAGWSVCFRMPLFKPGTRVRHRGSWETVNYVALRSQHLSVYLVGHEDPVNPSHLELEPLVFTTQRIPEAERLGYGINL